MNTQDIINQYKQGGGSVSPTTPGSTGGWYSDVKSGTYRPSVSQPPEDQGGQGALFTTTKGESAFSTAFKTAANVLPDFARTMMDLPIGTAKSLAQIPKEASSLVKESGGVTPAIKNYLGVLLDPSSYEQTQMARQMLHTIVPSAARKIAQGKFDEAAQDIANHPFQQISPFLFALEGAAKSAGYGKQFDTAISKTAEPALSLAGRVTSAAGDIAGKTRDVVAGVTTGKGRISAGEAFRAGREGGAAQETFRGTMRGTTTPQQISEMAKSSLDDLYQQRRDTYKANLKNLEQKTMQTKKGNLYIKRMVTDQDVKSRLAAEGSAGKESFVQTDLSTKGLKDVATKTLKSIGVDVAGGENIKSFIDENRPSMDSSTMQKVQSLVYRWKDMTPTGLDQLTQEIEGFRKGGLNLAPADNRFNLFIDRMSDNIRTYTEDRVPALKPLHEAYAKDTALIKEVTRDFSLGDNKSREAGMQKLVTAIKTDNKFKTDLLESVRQRTGVDLQKAISGYNMSQFTPGGITGRAIDVAAIAIKGISALINPSVLAGVLSTSPRIMGEFLNAMGVSARYTDQLISAMKQIKGFNLPVTKVPPQDKSTR